MRINLFNFDGKNVKLTEHCYTNWYLKAIIDKYGENVALKIFIVFQYMSDLTDANPYTNVSENEKLETIIRAVCPELPLEVDWNDELITEALELTRKLYETQNYKIYRAIKTQMDDFEEKLRTANLVLTKNDGNAKIIKEGFDLHGYLKDRMKQAKADLMEENKAVSAKGGYAFGYDE